MPLPNFVLRHKKMLDIEVFYADRQLVKRWNSMRPEGIPQYFAGHYWINGLKHNGPFQSHSAAVRDAYFVTVMHRPPEIPTQKGKKR
jgi:hypothetical protein